MYIPIKRGDYWYLAVTNFTQTDLGKIYVLCIVLVECVFPTTLLIILSFIAKSKFNQRVRKNQEKGLATNPNKLIKDEVQFSRLTMITMILFCTVRLIDMCAALALRLNVFTSFAILNCKAEPILYLVRQLTYLLLLSSHAFNTFIYFAMNSKLKEILPKGYVL